MTMRGNRTYVFRLIITYPEGSQEPGWRPALWSDPGYIATLPRLERWQLRRARFRWPRERLFLSASSAWFRAWTLARYGAQVRIRRSEQVTWDDSLPDLDVFDDIPVTQNW